MSLSNSIETFLLDPTVQNNSRTEFRLPKGYLSSAMRLADLGVYETNQTAATGLLYPQMLGVMASVRKLSLYSGATLIDEIQELPAWATLQHLRVNNDGAEDLNRFELLNSTSLGLNQDGAYSIMPVNRDYCQRYVNTGATGVAEVVPGNRLKIASAALDSTSGMVSLDSYLGFLASVPVLPDLPDLRLVIEWNTTAASYFQDPDAVTAVATPAYTPIRPTLFIDVLKDQPARARDFKLPFFSTIVERFPVTAPGVGTERRDSFRSGAFRQRFVKDLTFINQVTTDAGSLRAAERSVAMVGEKLQLVLNGSKYLPDQGIDQECQKLQYFNDTMGSLNLPLAAFLPNITDTSGHILSTSDHTTHPTSNLISNYSVTSVRINQLVERLDIEYTRTGGARDGQNAAFNLLCYGRCARELEVKGNNVRLSY